MVKSKIFLLVTLLEILILSVFFISAPGSGPRSLSRFAAKNELVKHLTLTDFAIWTEARYTRHPSQADFFSPFQDFPSSFEHFPAGSVIAPVVSAGGAP